MMRARNVAGAKADKAGCSHCGEHRASSGRWLGRGDRIIVLLGSSAAGRSAQPVSVKREISATAEEFAGSRVAAAIAQNRRYARTLEWAPHRRRILQLFGYDPYTPDPPEDVFARAVTAWQERNGLGADGVIGPTTWRHLQRAISEPVLSRVSPPERFQLVPLSRPGGGRVPLNERTDPAPDDVLWVPHSGGTAMVPLHRETARALVALQKAAQADGIRPPLLRPTSGYRSSARQRVLWERALKKYGSAQAARKWVAPPGSSTHQSGRAIDFYLGGPGGSGNVARLRTLPAYRWLVRNAVRFGFYPYEAEPWHWEYNPPAPGASELEMVLAEAVEEEMGC